MKPPVGPKDFKRCMMDAVKQGAIKAGEAGKLIERYEEKLEQNTFETGPVGAAARARQQLEEELAFAAAERKRLTALTVAATDEIKADLQKYRTIYTNKADAGSAMMNIIENYGMAGFGSVKGRLQALLAMAHSSMDKFIWEFRRTSIAGARMNVARLEEVVRAAFAENVSPQAQALYRAWLGQAEKMRQLFNAAGGTIGWKDGWGLPQVHEGRAVLQAGFERWRDYISERLNWDKMTHPDGRPILQAERPEVLKYVWESIVTNGWNSREPSMVNYRPALAKSRTDPRFLIFKDATSWIDYNQAFGKGEIYSTMMGHINGLAKDVAMMERLGPNPRGTIEWMKQVLESEAGKFKTGKPSLFNGKSRADADAQVHRNQVALDGYYEQMRGGAGGPENFTSLLGTTLRNWQYSAKLASAVILHLTTNPFIQAFSRYISGIPVARMFGDLFRSLGDASHQDLLRSSLIMEDALHVLGTGAREAGSMSRIAGASRILPDRVVTWTGLKPLVDVMKRTFQSGFMGTMADNLEKSFQELPRRLRQTMEGYGIDARDWRIMQMAETYQPVKGAPWLRWKEIRDVGTGDRAEELAALFGHSGPDADPATAAIAVANGTERTAMKYLEMVQQETERAVPSSTWRTRAMMVGRSDPGTITGQLIRSGSMFHGFMASMMWTQITAMMRETAQSKAQGAAYAGSFLTAMTLGGMAALQLKNLRSGKTPLSMDPTTPEGRNTWMHAMLSGGGLGIFGDFLASDRTSYGHGPLETLMGPIAALGADMVTGTYAMAGKIGKGKDPELGKAFVNFVRNNTPLLSTAWPLQAAYNRVAMDQLQFLLDPKAHKSWTDAEKRVFKETGQHYWWKPGAVLPGASP